MDNTFIQEKLLPRLTFDPGLALTGFRTTRPRRITALYDFVILEPTVYIVCSNLRIVYSSSLTSVSKLAEGPQGNTHSRFSFKLNILAAYIKRT